MTDNPPNLTLFGQMLQDQYAEARRQWREDHPLVDTREPRIRTPSEIAAEIAASAVIITPTEEEVP